MSIFEIAELWIYPVKSLGGMAVQRADITAGGSFAGDREWLVVDQTGQMLWQGDIPRMTLLAAAIVDGFLTLSQRDGTTFALPVDHAGSSKTVTQYGFTFESTDAGDAAAQWLSDFLAHPCRLVRIGAQAHKWGGLNPVHVVSLPTFGVLNQRLKDIGSEPIEIERLRPNLVLSGDHEAFSDEKISRLTFKHASLLMVEPCIRCELPNISRTDASRERQPLKLIGKMSKERSTSKPASFGMYCRAEGNLFALGEVANA